MSFSKRKRQKRTKERERVATFSPREKVPKEGLCVHSGQFGRLPNLTLASCKNHFPFGTLFVTEAHTRSPWCFIDALKSFVHCKIQKAKINNKISKSQLRVRFKSYWTVLGDRVGALESGSRYTLELPFARCPQPPKRTDLSFGGDCVGACTCTHCN